MHRLRRAIARSDPMRHDRLLGKTMKLPSPETVAFYLREVARGNEPAALLNREQQLWLLEHYYNQSEPKPMETEKLVEFVRARTKPELDKLSELVAKERSGRFKRAQEKRRRRRPKFTVLYNIECGSWVGTAWEFFDDDKAATARFKVLRDDHKACPVKRPYHEGCDYAHLAPVHRFDFDDDLSGPKAALLFRLQTTKPAFLDEVLAELPGRTDILRRIWTKLDGKRNSSDPLTLTEREILADVETELSCRKSGD